MQMTASDVSTYPKFARYVRRGLPEVANVRAIRTAARTYGQLSNQALANALRWGSGPQIKIQTFAASPTSFTNGEFTPNISSNEIRLNKVLIDAFEAGNPADLVYAQTASGRRLYRVGVTILHELMHWGDDQDGVDFPGEEGELFETAVYGHNTSG